MTDLIERLRAKARAASDISKAMAEAKSLRQESNTERRTDLYMWAAPEQTIEWQAADALTAYQGRVERLEEALEADLVWLDALSQDTIEREAAVARMKAVRAILSTAVDGKD